MFTIWKNHNVKSIAVIDNKANTGIRAIYISELRERKDGSSIRFSLIGNDESEGDFNINRISTDLFVFNGFIYRYSKHNYTARVFFQEPGLTYRRGEFPPEGYRWVFNMTLKKIAIYNGRPIKYDKRGYVFSVCKK